MQQHAGEAFEALLLQAKQFSADITFTCQGGAATAASGGTASPPSSTPPMSCPTDTSCLSRAHDGAPARGCEEGVADEGGSDDAEELGEEVAELEDNDDDVPALI